MSDALALFPAVIGGSQSNIDTECSIKIMANDEDYTFNAGTDYLAAALHILCVSMSSVYVTLPSTIITFPSISSYSMNNYQIYAFNPAASNYYSNLGSYSCTATSIKLSATGRFVCLFVVYREAA